MTRSHSSPQTASALTIAALVLSLPPACAHDAARVTVHRPAAPLSFVAVVDVELPEEPRPGEAARQTLALLDDLWEHSAWPCVASDQFHFLETPSLDFIHATDLVAIAARLGHAPKSFGVLRPRLSVREARGQAVVTGGARVARGHDYEGFADATVELFAADGRPIAAATATVKIDPFAPRPDNDDAPWLRQALQQATAALLAACSGCVRDVRRPSFELYANPAWVLRHRDAGRPPFAPRPGADPLAAEHETWRLFSFLRPRLSLDDSRRLARLGPAVCVGDQPPAPLAAGDCVLTVDAVPVALPHQLGSIAAATSASTVSLTVAGPGGATRPVDLPRALLLPAR
ncbi:MAG: hypothetical protein HY903_22135 [Deltaproteobacteria bacterium]|nr:hypothetical protein [Deltaproteobacteria bacterium]